MSENPRQIENEFKLVTDTGFLVTGFNARIGALADDFPVSNSQHNHAFCKLVKEFNRHLDNMGLSSNIIGAHDAGFLPTNIAEDFLGSVTTIGTNDFLRLENNSFVFQENGFKIILEQDI
jgi:hypothetical protein